MRHLRRLLPWGPIAVFLFMLAFSLSAGWLGVDPDMRWGLLRRGVFALGAAGLLGAACLQGIRALDRHLLAKAAAIEGNEREPEIHPSSSETRPECTEPLIPPPSGPGRRWIIPAAVTVVVAAIGIIYVGLVGVWHWTHWPATTTYYGALANAFTEGKTYLPIEPAPGLSDLKNPYTAWTGAGGIVNLSYYNERYFLYWGPAPALVLAILKILGAPTIGDQKVVFAAVSFTFLSSALIIHRLKRVFFRSMPLWLSLSGVVIVGTVHPLLWFQNSPSIVTAAIASGQAFLLGGVYLVLVALTEPSPSAWNYAAAGLLWGLALASRLTTIASLTTLILGVTILSMRRSEPTQRGKSAFVSMLALFVPLALVIALYGWYNLIRFGSPFETGWRYQFTAMDMNDQIARGALFSWRYLVPNIFYHLLAPLRPISSFPFLRAVYGEYTPFNQLLPRLGVPADYNVENASGLAFASPTLVFAVTFARKLLYGEVPRNSADNSHSVAAASSTLTQQGHIGLLLLISGLAGMLPTLLFFGAITRYEMDFVPLLAIVAVLGMWRLYEDTRPFPIQGRLATGVIILLVMAGTLVSFLLAVSGEGSRFDDLNPDLFNLLVNSLPHW